VSLPPQPPTPTLTAAQADSRVFNAMQAIVSQDGYTIRNFPGGVYATPPSDACRAGYGSSQLYMQAEYLDGANTPVPGSDGTPLMVGNGKAYSTNARGVKILALGGCVSGFFSPVLGIKGFRIAASSRAGLLQAGPNTTPTATPIPTSTAFLPSTTPIGIAPFLILGGPDPNGTTPHATPSPDTWSPVAPYMLFSQQSPQVQLGDHVQLVANASNWAARQYQNGFDGATATPAGVSLHDSSMVGCLSSGLITAYTGEDIGAFTAGGIGHCATFPPIGSTVTIPVTQQACKVSGGCTGGGYSYIVQAFVNVYITVSNNQDDLEGVITGVPYDFYHIIDPPPATATALPTKQPIGV
jgi:hypothetical protein